MIRRETLIEDLVEEVPEAVSYLMAKDIVCIACGAPIWGTLEEAARKEGYGDEEIDTFVAELRKLATKDAPG